MTALESIIDNLINGNLTTAKAKAKRRSHHDLRQAYQDATGRSDRTACAAADYLKGSISFQEYCDIEHEEGDRKCT
jgi:hypothetical protein